VRIPDVRHLEETYRQMTDQELLKLAEDLDSLTDRSKEVLKAELRRRHLEEATSPPTPVPAELLSQTRLSCASSKTLTAA